MAHYLGVARENDISEAQISAVQGIAMAVSAGRVNAQVRRVEEQSRKNEEQACVGSTL
jgi:uncharacterized membrane protein